MKRLRSEKSVTDARKESAAIVQRVERNLLLSFVSGLIVLVALLASANGLGQNLSQSTGGTGSPIASIVGLIVALSMANSLFVAGGEAVELLRPVHAKHLKEGASAQSARLESLIDDKQRVVASCVMAGQVVRLVMVYLAFVLTMSLDRYFLSIGRGSTDSTLLLAGAVVATPILVVNVFLGDVMPRSYASLHPHRVSLAVYWPIQAAVFVLWLPVAVMLVIHDFMKQKFGGTTSFSMPNQAEEEIKNIVESAQESGEIEVDEKELLHSVFEFTDTVAREVMTPRVDMDAMPVRSDPPDVIKIMQETGHSRIPLYEDSDDQIVGVIHAKDLLMEVLSAKDGKVNLRKLMRPAVFVPENKNLHDLLREMQTNRNHLVVVQDEFGGTAGIVTIEDIIEELVGDIVDEYDVEEPEVVSTASGFVVEGKTHLDDVNEEVGSHLESEDFDTIAGYVFGLFGRQPDVGESIESEGYKFTVADTDGRRILKLKIEPSDQIDSKAEAV